MKPNFVLIVTMFVSILFFVVPISAEPSFIVTVDNPNEEITCGCPDLNNDGIINLFDLTSTYHSADQTLDQAGYNALMDLNNDHIINNRDLDCIGGRFGQQSNTLSECTVDGEEQLSNDVELFTPTRFKQKIQTCLRFSGDNDESYANKFYWIDLKIGNTNVIHKGEGKIGDNLEKVGCTFRSELTLSDLEFEMIESIYSSSAVPVMVRLRTNSVDDESSSSLVVRDQKTVNFDIEITSMTVKNGGRQLSKTGEEVMQGEFLDFEVYLSDKGKTVNAGTVDIVHENKLIETINLDCKNQFKCVGTWHTVNAPLDDNTLTFNPIILDESGASVSTSEDYDILIRGFDPSFCKEVIPGFNDISANRVNIVFLGFGYEDEDKISGMEKFRSIIERFVDQNGVNDGLLSVTPFKENSNKFNFWYIDKISPLSHCALLKKGKSGVCSDKDDLAQHCFMSNKHVSHIIDSEFISTGGNPLQHSARYIDLRPEATENDRMLRIRVYVHEFGHQFRRLMDEYATKDHPQTNKNKRNCYDGPQRTVNECLENAQWKDFIGQGTGDLEVGCYESCNTVETPFFRSTKKSIMRSITGDQYGFGAWNEHLLREKLDQFTGVPA